MNRAVSIAAALVASIVGWLTGGRPAESVKIVGVSPAGTVLPVLASIAPPISGYVDDASPDSARFLHRQIARMSAAEVVAALEGLSPQWHDPRGLTARAVRALTDRLAMLDPAQLPEVRKRLPHFGGELAASAGAAVAAKEPAAAVAWSEPFAQPNEALAFWAAFGAAMDPERLAALKLPDRLRQMATVALSDRLTQDNPAAAKELAHDIPWTLPVVAANLARRDPQGTLDWLDTLPKGERRDLARHGAYVAWAAGDLTAAMAAFVACGPASLPPTHEWISVLMRWPPADVIGAWEKAPDAVTTRQRQVFGPAQIVTGWFAEVAAHWPDEALELIGQPHNERLRSDLVGGVWKAWQGIGPEALEPVARMNPAAFAEVLPKLSDAHQTALRPALLESWKREDPAAAAAWEGAYPAPHVDGREGR